MVEGDTKKMVTHKHTWASSVDVCWCCFSWSQRFENKVRSNWDHDDFSCVSATKPTKNMPEWCGIILNGRTSTSFHTIFVRTSTPSVTTCPHLQGMIAPPPCWARWPNVSDVPLQPAGGFWIKMPWPKNCLAMYRYNEEKNSHESWLWRELGEKQLCVFRWSLVPQLVWSGNSESALGIEVRNKTYPLDTQ